MSDESWWWYYAAANMGRGTYGFMKMDGVGMTGDGARRDIVLGSSVGFARASLGLALSVVERETVLRICE